MMERESLLRSAMETYGDTVYRLALCRTQSVPDAEDVYQEVFLRLWKQAAEDWDGDRAKAWLIRTTLNRCADLHRFHLRRPVLSFAEIPDLAQPEDESRELWEAVSRKGPDGGASLLRRGVFGGGDQPTDAHSRRHGPNPAPPGPQAVERTSGRY